MSDRSYFTREGRVSFEIGRYDSERVFIAIQPQQPGNLPAQLISLQVRSGLEVDSVRLLAVVGELSDLIDGMTVTESHLILPGAERPQ